MTALAALNYLKQTFKNFLTPTRYADVLFYAASSIDETWVRATILECRCRGRSCVLAVVGDLGAEAKRTLRRAGVSVLCNASNDTLRRLSAPVAITASSGVPRSTFGSDVETVVHMPHSIVSLHMIYPEDGFDGFDVLFAAGPHHIKEFEALSRLRGLGHRKALPVGYGKFDLMDQEAVDALEAGSGRHVLIAPSWGDHGLLPSVGAGLISALLARDVRVTLRPHPLHVLSNDPVLLDIREAFAGNEGFSEESPSSPPRSMSTANTLVTDFSGTAFEFAWLRRRPIVFVDVPKKIVNPSWEGIHLIPVEVGLREDLGVVVQPDAIAISNAAIDLCGDGSWRERIETTIPKFLFEKRRCRETAADAIDGLLGESVRAGGVSR